MKSPSRSVSVLAASRSLVVRLSVLCLTAAALVMLAAGPAAADGKHGHKHKHKHHHHDYHYYYDYDEYDEDVVVIVKPRPVYVAPPVVHHYHPAPVVGQPVLNVVIPIDLD